MRIVSVGFVIENIAQMAKSGFSVAAVDGCMNSAWKISFLVTKDRSDSANFVLTKLFYHRFLSFFSTVVLEII